VKECTCDDRMHTDIDLVRCVSESYIGRKVDERRRVYKY